MKFYLNVIIYYAIGLILILYFDNSMQYKAFAIDNAICHSNRNIPSKTYSNAIGPDHFSNKVWLTLGHGDYYSSDHKYIARFYNGYLDKNHIYKNPYCNVKILKVIKVVKHNFILHKLIINGNKLSCIEKCVWIPGQPHTLVIGTSSMYSSRAMILLWNGMKKIYYLKYGEIDSVESYDLIGASSNGIIYYHHINYNINNVMDENSKHKIHKIYLLNFLLRSH